MKILIKKSPFTFYEQYTVYDEQTQPLFTIDGSFISHPKTVIIKNMRGEAVGKVKKSNKVHSEFLVCDQKTEITLLERTFNSYSINDDNWRLDGRLLRHVYEPVVGDRLVMKFQKRLLSWGAYYKLEVEDAHDLVLALGIVVAIKRNKLLYRVASIITNL